MKWQRGTQNDNVVDVRGRKSVAPKVAGGSVAVVIVAMIVSRLIGYDVTSLVTGGGSPTQGAPGSAAPPQGPDPDAELVDFIKYVMKDIQDTFARMYPSYQHAKLYIFTDAIDTACGRSSSAIGPFYCPGDSNAYIDLSFYRDLKAQFGAPGDFAQAYVLAHEIGHHLQNLTREAGKEPARKRGESKNEYSVRVELQADCYAGVWAHHAQGKKLLEVGDIEEAMTAASAIGDDRLQKQAGGDVNPESFTHGTSAQRVAWFRRGLDAGKLEACDTFSAPTL